MKKGYTLIEILIVLALLASIFCGSVFTYKNIIKMEKNLSLHFYSNYITSFINNCKSYCKSMDVRGRIERCDGKNNLIFIVNDEIINRVSLPTYMRLGEIGNDSGKIEIDRMGFTSSACTIQVYSPYSKKKITVAVGTGYVEVKK